MTRTLRPALWAAPLGVLLAALLLDPRARAALAEASADFSLRTRAGD